MGSSQVCNPPSHKGNSPLSSKLGHDKDSGLERSQFLFSPNLNSPSVCGLGLCSYTSPLDGDMVTDSSEVTSLPPLAKEQGWFSLPASVFNMPEKDEVWPEYSLMSGVTFEEHSKGSFLS